MKQEYLSEILDCWDCFTDSASFSVNCLKAYISHLFVHSHFQSYGHLTWCFLKTLKSKFVHQVSHPKQIVKIKYQNLKASWIPRFLKHFLFLSTMHWTYVKIISWWSIIEFCAIDLYHWRQDWDGNVCSFCKSYS